MARVEMVVTREGQTEVRERAVFSVEQTSEAKLAFDLDRGLPVLLDLVRIECFAVANIESETTTRPRQSWTLVDESLGGGHAAIAASETGA